MASSPKKKDGQPQEANDARWAGILGSLDSKTKALGLAVLVVNALFATGVYFVPKEQVIYAMMICAGVLTVGIAGLVIIELYETRSKSSSVAIVMRDTATPQVEVLGGVNLDEIVNAFIQTMCNAFSLPHGPETTRFRIFIFQKQGTELVCTHHWAPNPVSERVNKLRFNISNDVANKVVVVKAFMNDRVSKTRVQPLPSDMPGVSGDPEPGLKYVLAAPIDTKDGQVWGTIDIDTEDDAGVKVLESKMTESALFRFAQHLGLLFSLPGVSPARHSQ